MPEFNLVGEGVKKMFLGEISPKYGWVAGMCAPPRPTPPRGKRAAPPRPAKKQVLPRPAKIGKSCGAGRGKVDLNPLKI